MSTPSSSLLFDDIFTISAIDKEGKKFDRGTALALRLFLSESSPFITVSRLYAHSKNYDMDLTLDYNIELFPLEAGQSFALALSSTLQRGGASKADGADEEDKEQDVWRPDGKGRRGLEDDYDYVMYGKVRSIPQLETGTVPNITFVKGLQV